MDIRRFYDGTPFFFVANVLWLWGTVNRFPGQENGSPGPGGRRSRPRCPTPTYLDGAEPLRSAWDSPLSSCVLTIFYHRYSAMSTNIQREKMVIWIICTFLKSFRKWGFRRLGGGRIHRDAEAGPAAAADGICPRGLLPHRDEKAVPHRDRRCGPMPYGNDRLRREGGTSGDPGPRGPGGVYGGCLCPGEQGAERGLRAGQKEGENGTGREVVRKLEILKVIKKG